MKVLWFTPTPCGASKKLESTTASGGWLSSLEQKLKENKAIELHVAFYYPKKIKNFIYNEVHYYPIYDKRQSSKINLLINNYKEYFWGFENHNFEELKKIINKIKPDIIHYHGSEQDYGLLQKEVLNIPSVISIQGVLNSCYEKLYSGMPLNLVSKYENILSKIFLTTAKMNDKRFAYGAKREREILYASKHVIGRTDFDKHTTLAMAPNAQYHIGNEILREEFYHHIWTPKESRGDFFTITSIISSGFYKGLEVVLRTAINLKRLNFNFKWIVIGQTESSKDAKIISKWIKKEYIKNNIIMVGKKNASEIIEILKNSDIYCQTGHIENSPNSLCEAMILGMPIIASYAGGTCSILEHNKEGYLLQDGDSYSLAGALIEIFRNYEKAKVWGKSARDRALKRHNPSKVSQEYFNIYKTILSSK